MFSLDFHGLKGSTPRTLTKIWGVSKFQVQSWEHIKENETVGSLVVIETNKRGGVNMAEEYDGEITFSSINSLKEQQNGEQSLQNNFWSLAEDIRRPEKQPIVFEGR